MCHRAKTAFFAAALVLETVLLAGTGLGAETVFRQSVMAEMRYDSNAGIEPESLRPESDYAFTLFPRFDLSQDRGGIKLALFYRPGGSFYFRNPDLNAVSHFAGIDADLMAGETTGLKASERFNYTKDMREADPDAVQTMRTGTTTNEIKAELTHEPAPGLSAKAVLSRRTLEFENRALVGTRIDGFGLSAAKAVREGLTLNANYMFSGFSFDTGSSSESHSLLAGFEAGLTRNTSLNASVGAVSSPDADRDRYDFSAATELTSVFNDSSLGLGYSRSVSNSSGLADLMSLNSRYTFRYSYNLSNETGMTFTGGYSRALSRPEAVIDITSYDAGLGISWRPSERFSANAGYRRSKQWSHGTIGTGMGRDNIFVSLDFVPFERRL